MNPLPVHKASRGITLIETVSSQPNLRSSLLSHHGFANHRIIPHPLQRAYPWLLIASTAVAALFCLLYITKPVEPPAFASPPLSSGLPMRPPASLPSTPPAAPVLAATPSALATAPATPATAPGMMPSADRLPGETTAAPAKSKSPTASTPPRVLPDARATSAFEETNVKIQHILTAQTPGGQIARIDLEVPVLYQSRSLRWTPDEITVARQLLLRLTDHQEKSRQLRADASTLVNDWNHLISRSLPATELRADSPSLPDNQHVASGQPAIDGLISTESIQIQPAGK